MRNNNAGCLTAITAGFSRIMLMCYWLARPAAMDAAFGTFIFPCLGFLFLPFTTLMYVLLWAPATGLQGLDWLWIGISVVLDLASLAGAGYGNRNRIPGYPSTM